MSGKRVLWGVFLGSMYNAIEETMPQKAIAKAMRLHGITEIDQAVAINPRVRHTFYQVRLIDSKKGKIRYA